MQADQAAARRSQGVAATMPALAKILVIFISTLLLTRFGIHLGLSLILGAITLNLCAGIAPLSAAINLCNAVLSSELWLIIGMMAMIIEIGRYVSETANANELISATQRWGGRHGRIGMLVAMPAVIGLIPMPAGAIFSAPFVQQASGDKDDRLAAWKSAVNYWFRHIWEYWWPLYPGVVIAMMIFKFDFFRFASAQVFFTPVSFLAGWMFLIRAHRERLSEQIAAVEGTNRRAMVVLLPLITVIVCLLVFSALLQRFAPYWKNQSGNSITLLASLAIGLLVVAIDKGRIANGSRKMFSSLFTRVSLDVFFSIIGVIVFKLMLTKSGLLSLAGAELKGSGISPAIAVAILPFVAGIVTGVALGFTGTSFPLVVEIMNSQGSGLTPLATLVLAYGFGYIGMTLSPVHLCLLVTRDYFKSSLMAIFKLILPCVTIILLFSIIAHIVLSKLGW